MTQRLKQFWNFGHNCAVLGLTLELAEQVLEDNRFTPYAITAEEKDHFVHGLYHTPHLWHKDTLKPIDIRPIVRVHTNRSDLYHRYVRRNPNYKPSLIKQKIAQQYWASADGQRMKTHLRKKRFAQLQEQT